MPKLERVSGLHKKAVTVWDYLGTEEKKEVFSFCDQYKRFLNRCKTERETVDCVVESARAQGFVLLECCRGLKPGDRVMAINRHKSVVLAVIGEDLPEKGLGIIAAHIDAPRLDLKPEPLYEDGYLGLLKTHYYGGIKKYQWVGMPLALHGVAVREDGAAVGINIGEEEDDPVFTVTDLLPHLAREQMDKKLAEGITGEALNILAGSIPVEGDGRERIKKEILRRLNDKYSITEEDLVSAELEAVPAWNARDIGLDRSMVGAYGQDDRSCAYAALQAICESERPPGKTSLLLLADREETGSMGNTGMQSAFFENFVAELVSGSDRTGGDLSLRRAMSASRALSADVSAAVDPNYEEVMDKLNSARLGKGVVLTRYTGARGKSGTSEAGAEFTALVRKIFNENGVYWQTGELGKVDQGGGGTVAYLLAAYDMDVIDCGVALLGMHSPFEVLSKADLYMCYRAYRAFWAGV